MFFRKTQKEIVVAKDKSTLFKFDYSFGLKNCKNQNFYQAEIESKDKAEWCRAEILRLMQKAITEGSIEDVDDGLIIRGSELSYFWVGMVSEYVK